MNNFKESDVMIMARAILVDPILFDDGDYTSCYYCNFCGSEAKNEYTIVHKKSCPVLIAHDIVDGI